MSLTIVTGRPYARSSEWDEFRQLRGNCASGIGHRDAPTLPHPQANRFPRVAQREDEEPRASELAGFQVPDHQALAVFHLAFAGRRRDDDVGVPRLAAATWSIVSGTERRRAPGLALD